MNIYKHKKTGKKVVTPEKLDKKHYTRISGLRNAQMKSENIKKK